MNWRNFLGTTTILLIVGGVIYAIKKSKDAEAMMEKTISVEEAVAEVEARKKKERENTNDSEETFVNKSWHDREAELDANEITNDIHDEVGFNLSFDSSRANQTELEEEDNELRHHPDSKEALQQYIRMELADWTLDEHVYLTMSNLFDFPFTPQNDGDKLLLRKLMDYRAGFFGVGSIWTPKISFADVILHYARSADYNCGEGVQYWVEYFLEFTDDLEHDNPSHKIDAAIQELNKHCYYNEGQDTYSLFGLTSDHFEEAFKIANENIDNNVTYDIEFNEFLKSCL